MLRTGKAENGRFADRRGYSRIKLAEESLNNWQVVGDGGEGEYIFHP